LGFRRCFCGYLALPHVPWVFTKAVRLRSIWMVPFRQWCSSRCGVAVLYMPILVTVVRQPWYFPSIRMCLEVFAKDRFWDVFWCRFLSRGFAALLSCVGVLFNLHSFAQLRCRLLQPPLQFLVVPRSCKVVARLCSLLVALRTSSQSWHGVLCRRFLAVQQCVYCTVV
jgi:hypothetical protein